MSKLRLTVIGGGSVGLVMAASLALAGIDLTLLARGPAVGQLRRDGIEVTGVLGTHTVAPGTIAIDDADRPDAASLDCDVLIVATKAYQLAGVLRPIAAKAGDTAAPRTILLLQNGWGSADEARAMMPGATAIFSSVMLIGSERRSARQVNINVQAGPVRIGSLFGSASDVIRALIAAAANGILPMVYDEKIEQAILSKFLFNNCLNASGALTGKTYGELLSNPHSRRLIIDLADEAIRVLAAARDYQAAEGGAHYVENILTPLVIPKAAAHRSSMLQDVEAGRRTEIDYLNGAVASMGHACGIATPVNEAILALIHARERNGW
ncbi:MAG TPA: 2-dehydropantoate 2-reductase [Accumulibacter sp.]|nr:2-dehydropantoate 2-reductase [Accumulibacter sp.]